MTLIIWRNKNRDFKYLRMCAIHNCNRALTSIKSIAFIRQINGLFFFELTWNNCFTKKFVQLKCRSSVWQMPKIVRFIEKVVRVYVIRSNSFEEKSWLFLTTFQFTFNLLTCRFSHPLNIPSSSALILLPDKSIILNWWSGRNSAVEKIGFNESPNRLSDSFKTTNVF